MVMSSSIFSSDLLVRYWRRPASDRRWHLLIAVTGLTVLIGGSAALNRHAGPGALRISSAQIVFVGTSHVTRGIAVTSPSVVKIDMAALDLAVAQRAVEKRLTDWPKLRVAVIEVDEFSLFSDTVHSYERNLSELCGKLSLNALELPPQPNDLRRNYVAISGLWSGRGYASLWERKRLTIQNVATARTAHTKKPIAPTAEGALARVAYARNNLFVRSASENCEHYNLPALLALIGTLEQREVEVRLIRFPTTAAYRDARPAVWQERIDEAVAEVTRNYPDVELWDYSCDHRFTDDDFDDVDHLGKAGARRFTDIVLTRIATQR